MTLNEVIFPDNSHMMDNPTTKFTSRLISDSYNKHPANMPDAAPASPCSSEESFDTTADVGITGRFSNIKHKYHMNPRVLGTGHNGSVRECIIGAASDMPSSQFVKATQRSSRAV